MITYLHIVIEKRNFKRTFNDKAARSEKHQHLNIMFGKLFLLLFGMVFCAQ